jgi:catalase
VSTERRKSRDDVIERSVGHFRAADPQYGGRVEAAVKQQRSGRR